MSDKLVTMRRGKPDENDIAIVRDEWVAEWKTYGYKVVKDNEAASEPSEPSEPAAPQA